MPDLFFFAEFHKRDSEERLVEGIASSEAIDNQPGVWRGQRYDGDLVEAAAVESALAEYLEWANIREMHQPSAVGTAVRAEMVDGRLHLAARVVDDGAWKKVREGVYRGFSIGGRVVEAALERLPDGRTIRRVAKIILQEISLVDRPANPDARILLWKGARPMSEQIINEIQVARNAAEVAGDMAGAGLYTQAIALVLKAAGAEAEVVEMAEATEAAETNDAEGDGEAVVEKATTPGRKSTDLHRVIRELAAGLAEGGDDEIAKAIVGLYTPKEPSTAETLAKALEPQFETLRGALQALDERLAKVEAQPAAGGPVLRTAEKQLATQPAETPVVDVAAVRKAAEIAELRRLAATDPNPALRQQYREQLNAATSTQA